MIELGIGGLSQGIVSDGVMRTGGFLRYVPLHLSAFDRQSGLLTWLQGWRPSTASALTVLSANG